MQSGFPFRREDLSMEEWWDLGVYAALLEDEREAARLSLIPAGKVL